MSFNTKSVLTCLDANRLPEIACSTCGKKLADVCSSDGPHAIRTAWHRIFDRQANAFVPVEPPVVEYNHGRCA